MENKKEIASDFIDLTDVCLGDLEEIDRPVLLESIRKIMHEVERPDEAAAGFQSSI